MAKFDPFKGDDWKDAANHVKDGLEDAGDAIADAGEDVGDALADAGQDVGEAFSDFGKDVEKGWHYGVEKPFKIMVINGVKREVVRPSKQAIANIEAEFHSKSDHVADRVEAHINAAAQAAVAELIKQGLITGLQVLELAVPSEMALTLGPVVIVFGDVKDRIETMRKWIDDPPIGRSRIKELILEFAPTSITISISAELAFLVVSSDSLSVGMDLTFDTKDFMDHFESVMDEFQI